MSLPGNMTLKAPYANTHTNTNPGNELGCSDQTIHADTPHLYVHTQLPGHYINQFCYAVDDNKLDFEIGIISSLTLVVMSSLSLSLGQTCFICGSHILEKSAEIMVGGKANDLTSRMIRYYHHHHYDHHCHYYYYYYYQTSSQSWRCFII